MFCLYHTTICTTVKQNYAEKSDFVQKSHESRLLDQRRGERVLRPVHGNACRPSAQSPPRFAIHHLPCILSAIRRQQHPAQPEGAIIYEQQAGKRNAGANNKISHKGRPAFCFREFARILCETHAERVKISVSCPSLFRAMVC